MRVLIVEDYAPQRKGLVRGFKEAGFAVDAAENGEEALWYAQGNEYDCIVLDLMLPRRDGASVLAELRGSGDSVPVLVLTARDTIGDRVSGLNSGADDYLTKPFAFEELLARVHAIIRRRYGSDQPTIRFGELEIDPVRRLVRRADEEVTMTSREFALLEYLARRAGEVVTRSEIWQHVYEFDSGAHSNVVDVYIGYLRRKLESGGHPRLIHTRRGHGYVMSESRCGR